MLDCCGSLPGIYCEILDGERTPEVNPQGNGDKTLGGAAGILPWSWARAALVGSSLK